MTPLSPKKNTSFYTHVGSTCCLHTPIKFLSTALTLSLFHSSLALAHGTMEYPVSRALQCYNEGPENPSSAACKSVKAIGGTQPIYDWNAISQNAGGNDTQFVDNGKLCAGGQDKYKGYDQARTDWVKTRLEPGQDIAFNFLGTAPHATKRWSYFITNDNYDSSQALKWADLDPLCEHGNIPLNNGHYAMSCKLPNEKSGNHIIYSIWERSDSAETFYTCMDVAIGETDTDLDESTNVPPSDSIVTNENPSAPFNANKAYVYGEKVSNNGNTYSCIVAGWCSYINTNNTAWAYAPGSGLYWENAWAAVDGNQVIIEQPPTETVETGVNNTGTAVPGKPSISWLPPSFDSTSVTLDVKWNMWWGVNAHHWLLFVDGEQVHSANLTMNGENAQSAGITTVLEGSGSHTLSVHLCSIDEQCSQESKTVQLAEGTVVETGSTGSNTGGTTSEEGEIDNTETNGLNAVYEQTSGKVIVSYFVEWGVYGRDYHVNDIPADNLTHILYGFLAICGDNPQATPGAARAIIKECRNKQNNEITLVDRFASLEKTYPGDTWSDNVEGDHYNGNFGQLRKLKARHPQLKILPSVGGWTLSSPFYSMAKNDANRAIFVASVIEFIKKYDFFDGIDLDWEYPVIPGADSGYGSPEDRQAYTNLMRDLRMALNTLSLETGRKYEITSAIGAGGDKINAVDYAEAHQYMDYIFMMTYDFAGAWENITGHHASLYPNNEYHEGFNASDAVFTLLKQGVPSEKIVMGAGFYGRAWAGVTNNNNHAEELFPLYGQANGPGKGTWEAGVYDYKDLYNNYIGTENKGINGFTVHYDETAQAPYLWNANTGEFISYDSPRSIKAKADFVSHHNLGGIMTWEIDADNGLLLNSINEGLGNSLKN